MKRFQDLEIPCTEQTARDFLALVERVTPTKPSWEINREAMGRSIDRVAFREGLFLYIDRLDKGKKPYAMVAFIFSPEKRGARAERIYVSNIVPLQGSELSFSHYNTVLRDFRDEIINPCLAEMPLKCAMTTDEFGIADVFQPECAERLRQFSGMANKSGLHPLDEERWRSFIISAYVTGTRTDADTLRRLLIEELDWPEDRALDLAIRYEQEIPLLKDYDDTVGRG